MFRYINKVLYAGIFSTTHQHSIDENLHEDTVPGQEAGEDILCQADLFILPLEVRLTRVWQPAFRGHSDLRYVPTPALTGRVTQLSQTEPEQR